MDLQMETIDFIESSTMRDFLKREITDGNFKFNAEEMCCIVWNSNSVISMKQAFFMELNEFPCAIDMIKRFESVRNYLQETHDNEVYVLTVNDRFTGVYNRFDVAGEEFKDICDDVDEDDDIYIEMYDIRGSKFRGRIKIDPGFEIISFDFSYDVIKEYSLWNNPDTDRIINLYMRLPHPFETGDEVVLKGGFETYKVINANLPYDYMNELNFSDMALEGTVIYDEDDSAELKLIDSALGEDTCETLPLLCLELL